MAPDYKYNVTLETNIIVIIGNGAQYSKGHVIK